MIDPNIQKSLREQYNPDGSKLRTLQLRLLDILIMFHDFCTKHNITYWIEGGTLLGAVRHGGFIPWDDDIDIDMPMEDYHRFIELAKTELPEGYVLHCHDTDPNYMLVFAKIRDLLGDLPENSITAKQYKYHGAGIDIFPIEPVIKPIGTLTTKMHNFMFNHLHNRIAQNAIWSLSNAIAIIARHIYKNGKRLDITYGKCYNLNLSKDILTPTGTIEFEGHLFNAPANVHQYLKNAFGNYMEIPQLENRETHLGWDASTTDS